ncbi:hypothetical protein DL98DRAFT_520450, partial [Cadophora sp. DSE1049]
MYRVLVHHLVTIGAEMVRTNMKINVRSHSGKRANSPYLRLTDHSLDPTLSHEPTRLCRI